MNKIKELFKKYRELIMYVIFGGLTTLVSILAFYFFDFILPKFETYDVEFRSGLIKLISEVISVLFAFFVNKFFVFNSENISLKLFLKEAALFFSGRIVTIVFGTVFMWIVVDCFNPDASSLYKMFFNIVSIVIEVVLNYFISKFFVFKKNKPNVEE